ncbi:MAG: hypothetical protein KY433_01635, partial [Actinobacteria bacterium]|nr:hypothetical protein [Actinomycetota bacterium]
SAVERPLSTWERLTNITVLRRLFVLAIIVLAWEAYATYQNNALMFPTFSATAAAFWDSVLNARLLQMAAVSISVLLKGYAIGIAIAMALTSLAVSTRIGNDLLSTLTSMFNPLPAIALLPLAMLWFGLGDAKGYSDDRFRKDVKWIIDVVKNAGVADWALQMPGRASGLIGARRAICERSCARLRKATARTRRCGRRGRVGGKCPPLTTASTSCTASTSTRSGAATPRTTAG